MENSPEEREAPDVITSDTDNATTIQPKEAPPGKREKFRKFRAYNTDMWNGPKRENTEQFRRQDNLHRYDSLASSLGLTDYQKSRGRNILDDFDLMNFGHKVDTVIFGICVLIANADVRNGNRYHPNDDLADDDRFEDVAASMDLDKGQQLSLIEKVRSRTSL